MSENKSWYEYLSPMAAVDAVKGVYEQWTNGKIDTKSEAAVAAWLDSLRSTVLNVPPSDPKAQQLFEAYGALEKYVTLTKGLPDGKALVSSQGQAASTTASGSQTPAAPKSGTAPMSRDQLVDRLLNHLKIAGAASKGAAAKEVTPDQAKDFREVIEQAGKLLAELCNLMGWPDTAENIRRMAAVAELIFRFIIIVDPDIIALIANGNISVVGVGTAPGLVRFTTPSLPALGSVPRYPGI